MSFLPKGYEAPKSNSAYTRFEQGSTKIRILSDAIVGMEVWKENKPHRFRMDEEITVESDQGRLPKHFWSMIAWNYKTNQIEICQINPVSIQNMIAAFEMNEDYGNPKGYDITITREGEGMETKYTVMPSPPKDITKEIQEAYQEKYVNLEALYDGADPFKELDESKKEAKEVFEKPTPVTPDEIDASNLPF